MITRLLAGLLIALPFLLHTPTPAAGQDHRARASVAKVLEDLHRTEARKSQAAGRWAAQRHLPRRLPQSDGRVVELVGLVSNRPVYLTSLNRRAAQVTGTTALYPNQMLDLGLTGRGMRLGIWDAGHVLGNHQELTGRVTFGDQASKDDHATHVAGTLVAAGVRAEAQGMAYEAGLRSYDWANDATEMSNEAREGLLVSNHSYGSVAGWYYGDIEGTGDKWYWFGDPSISEQEDYLFGWYDDEARQFDRVAYASPRLLPVVAAGNDRQDAGPTQGTYRAMNRRGHWTTYEVAERPVPPDGAPNGHDTIAGAAVAKNVLTVGSVGFDGKAYRSSYFSSFGPVDDGRVKPDLVGYGEWLLSSSSAAYDAYSRQSGTSMATPNVAGSLILLQQHFSDLKGRPMRAATLKGLALHTARDLHLPGPDYQTGWGLMDAEAAARLITASEGIPLALHEGTLENHQTFYKSAVVDEAGPLRLTLAWTDPPGVRRIVDGSSTLDDPSPHLQNDLDLRLIHEATGTVYLPYVLNPARPDLAAAQGDNRVDPVEQVYIPYIEPGTYTIAVSHKEPLYDDLAQPFSLIVSGARERLPVALTQMDADVSLDAVALQWQTAFEREPGTFVIERAPVTYPIDGDKQVGRFVQIGTVSADGPSETSQRYLFTDQHTLAGRYLYRLVHQNAEARYRAGEIEVNVPAPDAFAVVSNYPNPFTDRTSVILDLPETQQVRVEVYDALGRRVALLRDEVLQAGRHTFSVDASGWAPGLYLARVTTLRGSTTHRMMVTR